MQKWLFDISARINALVDVLDEADDKSIEPDIKNALAGIYESDVPAAIEDGIAYIKNQEAQVDAISAEIKRLQDLKKSRENRLARVRKGYTDFLIAVEKKKIETPKGTMTVAAPTISTIIDDAAMLPKEFLRETVRYDPDKKAIKDAILSNPNRIIPGAHLEEKISIRIK